LQPRDTCYVATSGLTELSYSGYQPHAYSWDDYPPLKDILDAVRIIFNQHWLLANEFFLFLFVNVTWYQFGLDFSL